MFNTEAAKKPWHIFNKGRKTVFKLPEFENIDLNFGFSNCDLFIYFIEYLIFGTYLIKFFFFLNS